MKDVAAGKGYWSPSLVECIHRECLGPSSLSRLLTATEQLVLSVIGDGSDDQYAAARLCLTESTVATIRRELHRKLGVKHRGELVRFAATEGYVPFTHDGVSRPGFALLLAVCPRRIKR